MAESFAKTYRELSELDPSSDLDNKLLHVSAEGLFWRNLPNDDISKDQLKNLLYFMILTRKTDEEISSLYRKSIAMGKHLTSTGNEATAVGAGCALGPLDWFAPAIRDLGTHLIRGITPYEVLCQACGRIDGPTKGWDASIHFGDPKRRIVPLISHLGVLPPIATGCALGMKYNKIGGAALTFCGDGATSMGPVHEAINIASVKELPLVVVIENNQWAFGTPNCFEFRCPTLALRSLGYGSKVEGFLIDGTNVITVYHTVNKALERARQENIITIIEAVSMRMQGHSLADPYKTYVPLKQLEAWAKKDPIQTFKKYLVDSKTFTNEELVEIEQKADTEVKEASLRTEKCTQPEANDIEKAVFVPAPELKNALIIPPKKGKHITYHEAIRKALFEEMERDSSIFIIGEEVGLSGGAFRVTEGFSEQFDNIKTPKNYEELKSIIQRRVHDIPLAETGFVGLAAGATYEGLRPIVEFQFADFSSSAFMMIVNFIATQTARGFGPMPIVFRLPSGWAGHTSAYHSINPESWFASTPGLKIVAPITSFDAKGLLKASIRDDNPVMYLEYKKHYRNKFENLPRELNTPVPDEDYIVPIGKARILKEGSDLTLISYGSQVFTALQAANAAEKDSGASIEVIDLRSIIPWDKTCCFDSVKKTSRAVVTCEASWTACFGHTIVSEIGQNCFYNLDAPVKLVASADTPFPFSTPLEQAYLPTRQKIVSAIKEILKN